MRSQKSRTRLSDFHYGGLGINFPARGKHSRSSVIAPPKCNWHLQWSGAALQAAHPCPVSSHFHCCQHSTDTVAPFPTSGVWSRASSTKKHSRSQEVKNYFTWWGCLGLQAQETEPQYLRENCSKEAGEEVRLHRSLQQME